MAANQGSVKRGFAGLEGLIPQLSLPEVPPASTPPVPRASAPTSLPPATGMSVRWGRVAALGAAILVVIVISNWPNQDNAPSSVAVPAAPPAVAPGLAREPVEPANGPPDAATVATASASETSTAAPAERSPGVGGSWQESRPAGGLGSVLVGPTLNYCLGLEARMDILKSSLDRTSDIEINGFNGMVAEFKARCANAQYFTDEMSNARANLATHHDDMARQANAILRKWRREAELSAQPDGSDAAQANAATARTNSDANP
jgi:hypothetical protein